MSLTSEIRTIVMVSRVQHLFFVHYRTNKAEVVPFKAASPYSFDTFEDALGYATVYHSAFLVFGKSLLIGHDSLEEVGAEEGLVEIPEAFTRLSFSSLWDKVAL